MGLACQANVNLRLACLSLRRRKSLLSSREVRSPRPAARSPHYPVDVTQS